MEYVLLVMLFPTDISAAFGCIMCLITQPKYILIISQHTLNWRCEPRTVSAVMWLVASTFKLINLLHSFNNQPLLKDMKTYAHAHSCHTGQLWCLDSGPSYTNQIISKKWLMSLQMWKLSRGWCIISYLYVLDTLKLQTTPFPTDLIDLEHIKYTCLSCSQVQCVWRRMEYNIHNFIFSICVQPTKTKNSFVLGIRKNFGIRYFLLLNVIIGLGLQKSISVAL